MFPARDSVGREQCPRGGFPGTHELGPGGWGPRAIFGSGGGLCGPPSIFYKSLLPGNEVPRASPRLEEGERVALLPFFDSGPGDGVPGA